MIEQMVRDYLIRKTKIPAFMEKEPDMPKEYFLIEKTGSGKDNHIRQVSARCAGDISSRRSWTGKPRPSSWKPANSSSAS